MPQLHDRRAARKSFTACPAATDIPIARFLSSRLHRCYSSHSGQRSARNERLTGVLHLLSCLLSIATANLTFLLPSLWAPTTAAQVTHDARRAEHTHTHPTLVCPALCFLLGLRHRAVHAAALSTLHDLVPSLLSAASPHEGVVLALARAAEVVGDGTQRQTLAYTVARAVGRNGCSGAQPRAHAREEVALRARILGFDADIWAGDRYDDLLLSTK